MHILATRNIEILRKIDQEISLIITSEKTRTKIKYFLNKVERVIKQIGQLSTQNALSNNPDNKKHNLLNEFCLNTEQLLGTVPAHKKSSSMQNLPATFTKSIEQIVAHIGHDNWLKIEPLPDNMNDTDQGMPVSLVMENNRHDTGRTATHDTPSPPTKRTKKTDPVMPVGKSQGNTSDLGYPQEYHGLTGKTTLSQLLEPLFNLLFPVSTHISSGRHCRKTAHQSLNTVLAARLGPGQDGNMMLYKILTDDVLAKSFRDDRIIQLFHQSIHIGLLKVVIATTLYRIEQKPIKIANLNGISFFMELEEDMLQSSLIRDTVLRLIVIPEAAKGVFQGINGQERKDFMELFAKD